MTVFCFALVCVPSVNGFYWFLTALSTELYMIMYLLMFGAAIRLHYSHKNRENAFKVPGKGFGIWTICLLGILGASTTIVVSFFPPDNASIGSSVHYLLMICVGNILAISPLAFFYLYQGRSNSKVIVEGV